MSAATDGAELPRITVLLGSLQRGGAELQALRLAEGLRDCGRFHVTLAGLGAEGAFGTVSRTAGFIPRTLPRPESRFPLLSRIKTALAAERLVRTTRPRVIIAFTSPANIVAGCAVRPGIAAIWGQRDEGLHRFAIDRERRALAACVCAVANGPGAEEFLLRIGCSADRIVRIPNGVRLPPPHADRTAWRTRTGIPVDALVVTMLANLTRAKDHATLLTAWRGVEHRNPTAHLVLAGSPGDGSTDVHAAIGRHGLRRVHLPGSVDDVAGLLAASDLAVLSSRSEGLPNAVLEAMAAGLPVLATDNPGCRALLEAESLVPAADAPALEGAILRLLDDPLERTRSGAFNQERARTLFTTDGFVARFIEVIDRLLADGRPASASAGP